MNTITIKSTIAPVFLSLTCLLSFLPHTLTQRRQTDIQAQILGTFHLPLPLCLSLSPFSIALISFVIRTHEHYFLLLLST